MIIRFTPDADAELAEARQWYAHQQEYLDIDFMSRIDEALTCVVNNPFSYPVVYGTLGRAVVRRFPFAIFYEITTDENSGHSCFPFTPRSKEVEVASGITLRANLKQQGHQRLAACKRSRTAPHRPS